MRQSWSPATGQQEEVGETTQYTLEAPDDRVAQEIKDLAARTGNVRYVEEVRVERKLGEKVEEVGSFAAPLAPFPDSLEYIRVRALLGNGFNGKGCLVLGSDTGCSPVVASMFGARFRPGRNFTASGNGESDTTDRDGHGSGTGYMSTPPQADYMPLKVLGDDGSGSSDGIVKSFYYASSVQEANPNTPIVLNCSWGSAVTNRYFQPYKDALDHVTARGIIVVISAGNDNAYGLGSPSNFSRINEKVISSIAFDRRSDQRATFSNYHEDGSISAPGVAEPGYDENGTVILWNGTSFSAPWTTFALICLATPDKGANLNVVAATLKKSGRDSGEPTAEEGGGVVDCEAVAGKIVPKPPPPAKPVKQLSVYAFYRDFSRYRSQECEIFGAARDLKTGVSYGRYIPKKP